MDEMKNYWRWTPLQPAVFIDEITYYEQLMLIKKKVNEIIDKINDGDIIAKQLQPGAEIAIDGGMLGDGVNFTGAENIDIDTFLMNSVYVSSKVGNHLIFKTKDITPDFKTTLTFLWQELPVNASCGKDNLGWGILRLNAVYKETDADIDYNSYNIEVLDFAFESERNVFNRRKDIRDRFKLTRRINPCDNSKNTMELYYTVPEVLPETECNSPIGPTCLFTLISADTNPHIEFDTQIILMNDGLNDTTYDIGTSGITINPVINYPFDSIELTGDTIGKKDPIDNRDIVIHTETPQLIDSITVQGKAESQKVDIPKVYSPDKNDIVLEIDTLNITPEDLPIATRNSLGVVQIGDGLDITPEGLLSSTGATGGSVVIPKEDGPTDIYFSLQGNDNNDGLTPETPQSDITKLLNKRIAKDIKLHLMGADTPETVLKINGAGYNNIDIVIEENFGSYGSIELYNVIGSLTNQVQTMDILPILEEGQPLPNPAKVSYEYIQPLTEEEEVQVIVHASTYAAGEVGTINHLKIVGSKMTVSNLTITEGDIEKSILDLDGMTFNTTNIFDSNINVFNGITLNTCEIGYCHIKFEDRDYMTEYYNLMSHVSKYSNTKIESVGIRWIDESNNNYSIITNCELSLLSRYTFSNSYSLISNSIINGLRSTFFEGGYNKFKNSVYSNIYYDSDGNQMAKKEGYSVLSSTYFDEIEESGESNLKPKIATTNRAGIVRPDGTTITIDSNGIISSTGGSDPYTLPIASAEVLGGIKIGSNLSITEDGVLSAEATPDPYTLPVASDSILGGVKVPSNSEVKIDGEGNLTLAKTIPDPYTLPVATDSVLGGVKVSEGSGLSITPDGQLSSLGQYADINLIPVNEEVITYYVDFTNGSDLNTGSQQSPLKSIEAAINKHTTKNIIISLSGSNTEGMILLDAFGYDSIQITSSFNVSVNELVCQNGNITINSGFTTSNLIIRNADLTLGGGTDFNITNSLTVMNSIFRYSNITQEITIPEMSVYNSLIYRNKSMKVSKGFRAYDSQFLTSDSYTFKITTASGGYLAIENCIFDRGYVDNRALSQITIRNITLNKGSAGGHYFNNVIIQNVSSGGDPDPDQFTTQGSKFYLTNCKINGGHLVLSDLYFAGVCKIGSCQVYNRLNPAIYDTDTTGSDTLLFVNCNCIFNSSRNKNSDKVSFETCVILDSDSNISNYPNTGCAILTT